MKINKARTNMNYEQKYNEALKWVQKLYPSFEDLVKEDAEHYFPELKESEDERIKREILELVSIAGNGNQFEEIKDWLKKQGEQPTDKIESKFKVGDWVILNGIVAKILDKQKYGFVGLDIDGKDFFCNYGHTDSMRLWSINDAKDGDVLVDGKDGRPFIFTGNFDARDDNPIAYCGINSIKKFMISSGSHWTFRDRVKPATKEQRDLLFSKMKEAGYVWDADKKELKKVESKKLDPDKVIAWLVANICDYDYYVKLFKEDFGL